MGGELDRSELNIMFEGAKQIGILALEYLAMDFWAVSVEHANIKWGTLRDSIQPDQQNDNVWTVGTNLEYAPFVHEGTEPHLITSQYWDGYLYWPGAKHPVRYVEHPGYEGNPWFDTALDIIEGRSDEYLQRAMDDLT